MNKCNHYKPKWDEHSYAAICMSGDSKWYGLHDAVKPFYNEEWKGKEVTLLRSQADFLKHGENPNNVDIELFYEVRP